MPTENPTPFAVKIHRRGIADAELLADVKAVAEKLKTDRLSGPSYDELGQFTWTTVMKRFGSWTAALRRVGLKPASRFHATRETLLRDIQRVARQLNTSSPLHSAYHRQGRFSTNAVRRFFGSWHRALQAAGLVPAHYRCLTDEELFENLKNLWQQLGCQPTSKQCRPPLSRYTVGPYHTRFGTWCHALRAFEAAMHPELAQPALPPRRRRVSTHINWRLRYEVLQRDHFRCRACGRSPATDPGCKLQIDHKIPRSKGGLSTLENLQTLCEICNGGKGDL